MNASQAFGYRFRFKLRGDLEAEPWGRWLICPTGRYLENDASGPYSVRQLEWVEIEPNEAGLGALVEEFSAVGVLATVVYRSVRVHVPDAELPAPEFAIGDRVAVRVNERNRTPHVGEVHEVIWHFKDARYNYYLTENGKKIAKRYFADDLVRVSD